MEIGDRGIHREMLPIGGELNPVVTGDTIDISPDDIFIKTRATGSKEKIPAHKTLRAMTSIPGSIGGNAAANGAPSGSSSLAGGTSSAQAAEMLLENDALTDLELWRIKIPEGAMAPPAFGNDGSLYMVTDKGISVISNEGQEVAQIKKPSLETRARPFIGDDGTIFVSGTYKTSGLTALSPEGKVLWERTDGSSGISACQGPQGTIYFGNNRGYVYQIGKDGKDTMWCPVDESVGGKIRSLSVGGDGTVYTTCDNGELRILDGKERLQYSQGKIIFSASRYEPDKVVRIEAGVCPVDSPAQGCVYANNQGDLSFREPDGTEIWRVSSKYLKRYDSLSAGEKKDAAKGWIQSAFGTTPVLSNEKDTLYVGTVPLHKSYSEEDPSLVALGLDGTVKWKVDLPFPKRDFIGAQNVQVGDDGTIYVAGERGGMVIAVSPEGKLLWGFGHGDYNQDFRISTRGDVTYLTTKDGSVHALKSNALMERARHISEESQGKKIPVIVVGNDYIQIDGISLPINKG